MQRPIGASLLVVQRPVCCFVGTHARLSLSLRQYLYFFREFFVFVTNIGFDTVYRALLDNSLCAIGQVHKPNFFLNESLAWKVSSGCRRYVCISLCKVTRNLLNGKFMTKFLELTLRGLFLRSKSARMLCDKAILCLSPGIFVAQ